MSSPIVNPEIPFNGNIPGGIQPGKMCRVQGVTHPNTDRFNINLQTGPSNKPRDDTALHLSIRLNQGYIARNSYKDGAWGDEQGSGMLPIGPAQAFEILILVEPNHYKVAVNGQHFCEFPHRIPFNDVSHLLIDGDVSITLISWESAKPIIESVTPESSTEGLQTSPQQFGQPQEQYGAQPAGYRPQEPYGPTPGGYGPTPGGYGPAPGGYGPAPGGYGPPLPPGAQPESGFDSFLEQAQSVLAGAIKSGAAEKLLSGLLSSGGQQNQPQGQGYAPQNAQYGIYPQLPREDHTHQVQQSKGIDLGSLLTGLLSSGNDKQLENYGSSHPSQQQINQRPEQMGGQPQQLPQDGRTHQAQQSQGIDLGSLLTGLLSSGNDKQPENYGSSHPPQQQTNQRPEQNIQDQFQSTIPQGGQSHQQYGQYPHLPSHQEQRGPFENLLSGLLSTGSNQQEQRYTNQPQPHIPQIGGEGSVGGLGSMGGILSNLAGKILHNPKDGNQYQN